MTNQPSTSTQTGSGALGRAGAPSWLRSRHGRYGYIAGWLTFATGFATVYWFGRPNLSRAALAAATVIPPAALLGLLVVRVCHRLPDDWTSRWWMAILHPILALTFSAAWIGGVWLTANIIGFVQGSPFGGLPPAHILHWHLLAGSLLYAVLASVTLGYRRALAEERRRVSAELRLLFAPLHPHFLLNALHAVFAITRKDPDAGERALDTLVQLLRHIHEVQHDAPAFVPLETEWAFTQKYLELERLRLGDRLELAVDVDEDALDCLVPPFVLQPLVENAVKHGIAARAAGGRMVIEARREGHELRVSVLNDTPGQTGAPAQRTGGTGLQSISARLAALYGVRARCTATVDQPGSFGVTIWLPADDPPAWLGVRP